MSINITKGINKSLNTYDSAKKYHVFKQFHNLKYVSASYPGLYKGIIAVERIKYSELPYNDAVPVLVVHGGFTRCSEG